ncbi:hypothetical protein PBY51_015491 [Eleginops maclovinus]|uniref:Ninein-like protein n=2 Tax=Eleginops maclovinus TaxID=56733 RepID=A0AAN7X2R6_ELEMC|nr:hypothetical protein PBY51_015491 [Eleginops maclovinus]
MYCTSGLISGCGLLTWVRTDRKTAFTRTSCYTQAAAALEERSARSTSPSLLTATVGQRVLSRLDEGSGCTGPEKVVNLWTEEGIRNSRDILQTLDFSLEERLSLADLTLALDNELLVSGNGIHQAALISYKNEIQHLQVQVEQACRQRDKVKADLDQAEHRNLQLVREVDDRHACMETLNHSRIRELQQDFRERVQCVRSEAEQESEALLEQGEQERAALQEELQLLRVQELQLQEELCSTVQESRRLEEDLRTVKLKLSEAESSVNKLQRDLDQLLQLKFGSLDPAAAGLSHEERVCEIAKDYELQCRELRDRNDELSSEVELLKNQRSERRSRRSAGDAPSWTQQHNSESDSDESDMKRSASPPTRKKLQPSDKTALCSLEELSGPALSIQTELAVEQLKQKHNEEVQQLHIQLETQVNYYERNLEVMRQSMEVERKDISQAFKMEISEMEEQKAQVEQQVKELKEALEKRGGGGGGLSHEQERKMQREHAELEQNFAREIGNLVQRLSDEKDQLEAELKLQMDRELMLVREEETQRSHMQLQHNEEQRAFWENRLDQSEQEKKRLEEQLDQSEQEKKRPEEQLDQSEQENKRLEEQLDQSEQENKRLEEQLDQSEQEKKRLEEQLDQSEQENKRLEEQLDQSEQENKRLEEQLDQSEQEKKRLEEQLTILQEAVHNSHLLLSQSEANTQEVRKRCEELEEHLKASRRRCEELEEHLKASRRRCEELEGDQRRCEELEGDQRRCEELEQRLKEACCQLEESIVFLESQELLNKRLEEEVLQSGSREEQLRVQLENLQEYASSLAEESDSLRRDCARLIQDLKEQAMAVEHLQEELDERRSGEEVLQEEVRRLNQENRSYSRLADQLSEQIVEMEEEICRSSEEEEQKKKLFEEEKRRRLQEFEEEKKRMQQEFEEQKKKMFEEEKKRKLQEFEEEKKKMFEEEKKRKLQEFEEEKKMMFKEKMRRTPQETEEEKKRMQQEFEEQKKKMFEEEKKRKLQEFEEEKKKMFEEEKKRMQQEFEEQKKKMFEVEKRRLQEFEEEKKMMFKEKMRRTLQETEEEKRRMWLKFEEEQKSLQQEFEEEKKRLQQEFGEEKKRLQQEFEEEKRRLQQEFEEEKRRLQQEFEEEKRRRQQQLEEMEALVLALEVVMDSSSPHRIQLEEERSEKAALQERLSVLQQEVQSLEDDVSKRRRKLEEMEMEHRRSREEEERLHKENSGYREEVLVLSSRNLQLSNDNAELSTRLHGDQESVRMLRERLATVAKEQEEGGGAVRRLQDALQQQQREKQQLQAAWTQQRTLQDAELNSCKDKLERLSGVQAELSSVTLKLQWMEEDKNRLLKEAEERNKKLEDLQESLLGVDSEVELLRAQLLSVSQEKLQHTQEVTSMNRKLQDAQSTVEELLREKEDQPSSSLQEETLKLRVQNQELQHKLSELQIRGLEVQKLTREQQTLKSRVSELQAERNQNQDQAVREVLRLHSQQSSSQISMKQDQYEKAVSALQQKVVQLETKLKGVQLVLQEKVQQLKEQLSKNSQLSAMLKDLYVENSQLMKALQVTEQRQKNAEKKNFLLEDKVSALNQLLRDIVPAALAT